MTDRRKQPRSEGWRPWRWPERILFWLYGFLLGPFLTKLPDGTVQGAMTRWAVAFFTAAEVHRLWFLPFGTATMAEGFIVFCILFALPIDGALTRAKPQEVLELLGKPFAGTASAIDQGANVVTTVRQEVTPTPPPADDGALG